MAVRVPLTFVRPTMRLAHPIQDAEGRLVAGVGTQLSDRVVGHLRKLAIQAVAVTSAEDLPNWEIVQPLAEALAHLDARFATHPETAERSQLHAAVVRHFTRRARLHDEEPGS